MIITRPRARKVSKQAFPHLVAMSEGANIALDKPILLIGRHQECDIQIPSRKISRRHCCIALITDHLVVRDLGSTNGIRINGIKVVEGNLQPNDELTIGNMRYQLQWMGDSAHTIRAASDQVAKAAKPAAKPASDESFEEPMPLPEIDVIPPAAPKPKPARPGQLDIPDEIGLAPLDPPAQS
jgi:hypothetical protein